MCRKAKEERIFRKEKIDSSENESFGRGVLFAHERSIQVGNRSCDGCNCPSNVTLDPEGGTRIKILTSQRPTPFEERTNNCTWNIQATQGNITLLVDKVNLSWTKGCKESNHLYVGNIHKYSEVWLCGSESKHLSRLRSKNGRLLIRFVSQPLESNQGFRVYLIASG